ncbi:hypothetical protein ACFFHM_22560 [Halalkalibacter kiskunsagensis]|uniref:Uncharacterized protein n=1 Tax=Halalkalibacter kiskunsagensis TaxID=1548599 RepID=A0ABV6KIQ0_9BACI
MDFPIRNVVLCPTGIIDNKIKGARVELIDRRNFATWHDRVKNHSSPIKSQQMRVISLLFEYCNTTSTKRNQLVRED